MEISGVFCNNKTMVPAKPKFDFPIGLTPMTQEEAQRQMAEFFQQLEEEFKNVPPEEIAVAAQKFQNYMNGKISWADLMNLSPNTMLAIADFGYQQLKHGRYSDAERVFKVLTVLDWNNGYYHAMMGSVLQRQKRYGEAIAEYNEAIELNPYDEMSYTHRGEIYLLHGLLPEAEADLEKAISLGVNSSSQWAERARLLLQQVAKQTKG